MANLRRCWSIVPIVLAPHRKRCFCICSVAAKCCKYKLGNARMSTYLSTSSAFVQYKCHNGRESPRDNKRFGVVRHSDDSGGSVPVYIRHFLRRSVQLYGLEASHSDAHSLLWVAVAPGSGMVRYIQGYQLCGSHFHVSIKYVFFFFFSNVIV